MNTIGYTQLSITLPLPAVPPYMEGKGEVDNDWQVSSWVSVPSIIGRDINTKNWFSFSLFGVAAFF
jgi:hypothetical protein